jgi:hypothetical protein
MPFAIDWCRSCALESRYVVDHSWSAMPGTGRGLPRNCRRAGEGTGDRNPVRERLAVPASRACLSLR